MIPLFAQAAPILGFSRGVWLTILAFVAVLLLIPILLLWRNSRMRHEEQMKAMDLGFTPDHRPSRWPLAIYGGAVGAGVPVGTFALTLAAVLSLPASPENIFIWIVPGVVSVVAIVATTIVVGVTFNRPDPLARAVAPDPKFKPVASPDAFDFAGRVGRG